MPHFFTHLLDLRQVPATSNSIQPPMCDAKENKILNVKLQFSSRFCNFTREFQYN